MGVLSKIRTYFAPKIVDQSVMVQVPDGLRVRPGQAEDARFLFAPGGGTAEQALVWYALNTWVYTAVNKLAEAATVAPLHVAKRDQLGSLVDTHPLLDLLGQYGRPNDDQDCFEFWEQHYSTLILAGNSYWFWNNFRGGAAPTEVYQLDPRHVWVIPGTSRTVAGYEYRVGAQRYRLAPEQITHFKRYNPFSNYYGLTAMEALRLEVNGDRTMALWNAEFFNGPAVPAGILVVPDSVTPTERQRIEDELNAKHVGERRTAVVRASAGATAWLDAGLKAGDVDFEKGRMLSRQATYEALGLPVGMMSEASTEAHARVSERRYLHSVWVWHQRTSAKLNRDAMPFWLGFSNLTATFEDVRVADADQLSKLIKAIESHVTSNEIRTKYLGLPPREGGDDVVSKQVNAGISAKRPDAQDRGNIQPVQRERRARNDLPA